ESPRSPLVPNFTAILLSSSRNRHVILSLYRSGGQRTQLSASSCGRPRKRQERTFGERSVSRPIASTKTKRAQRGRRCAGLLNLIGNWEEEYCRSYLATLGGGVRRF